MDLEERKTKAKNLFASYLKAKGGRFTSERMKILDEVVERRTKFTIEELEEILQAKHFRVAHGTLYNTLRELIDAHLVRKFQIGKAAHFQFRDSRPQNFHQVCSRCGKVMEFQNAELERLLKTYTSRRFVVQEFSVTLRGICSTCSALQKKLEKENNKNKKEQ